MAKIKNPVRFSDHFGIDVAALDKVGVLNPTLNVDTRLFIDPLLLEGSSHPEISGSAHQSYLAHFEQAIGLLGAVKQENDSDYYWRMAYRQLSFPELKGTCLGYGSTSVAGSGSGDKLTRQIRETAKAIVDLGVKDPDLFVAMALFEDNFGPDRIGDMATNIVIRELLTFNNRILNDLNIPLEEFDIRVGTGKVYHAKLPRNIYSKGKRSVPVILVPTDILRDLPIATDWEDVAYAASQSAEIRSRVNDHIAELWKTKTLKDKEEMRQWALHDRKSFETLLEMIHGVDYTAYDWKGDPRGELLWRQLLNDLAQQ